MELPREKILNSGARRLELSELLSIVLNTGYKNESVFDISKRIIKDYGEDISIFNSVERIVEQLKLPIVKASQLCATIEIGRRIFDNKEDYFINSNKKIFEMFKYLSKLKNPELYIIIMDINNRIIIKNLIFIGFGIKNLDIKIIFKSLFEFDFKKFIIVYGGNSIYLSEDIIETALGIRDKSNFLDIIFLDFIIINKDENLSFKNKGII